MEKGRERLKDICRERKRERERERKRERVKVSGGMQGRGFDKRHNVL